MLKEERQQTILNEVDLHNRILITDIAEALDVSIDTIRRDVKSRKYVARWCGYIYRWRYNLYGTCTYYS